MEVLLKLVLCNDNDNTNQLIDDDNDDKNWDSIDTIGNNHQDDGDVLIERVR